MDSDNNGNAGLRILFMGTPGFAVPSLEVLLENNCNVVGVVTVADKPAGRGYKLRQSDIKKCASKHELKTLQPLDLEDPVFIKELQDLNIDLIVIVAFRKLPRIVWEMPKKGTFNLHGSLLPKYRGAAPLNWAIINGDDKTGVTTFFLEEKIDTGKIISQKEIKVGVNDNVGDVHDKLMYVGAQLVLDTVKEIANNTIVAVEQDVKSIPEYQKKAPKIFKTTGLIDWNLPVEKIHNLVRGLSPYPGSHTVLENESGKRLKVKVFRTEIEQEVSSGEKQTVGGIVTDSKTELKVNCPEGQLKILELQLEGKKRMTTQQFLQGNKLQGCRFV